MAEQREEEQHAEDMVASRKWKAAPRSWMSYEKPSELVVNERMLQSQKVKNTKGRKEVPGWSSEEMKVRPNVAVEEDTEEMK